MTLEETLPIFQSLALYNYIMGLTPPSQDVRALEIKACLFPKQHILT